jgi:hypothetical protein
MAEQQIIGRLLRASNRGFVFGCKLAERDSIEFGSLVRAQAQAGQTVVYGLVYEIQVTDDGLVRQLSVADESLLSEPRPDERHHRAAPNEVSVLTVAYRRKRGDVALHRLYYGPAPQPPLSLDAIAACAPEEVREFTAQWDWLRLVLQTRQVPADDLAVAALLLSAAAIHPEKQRAFLLQAGRELARLMPGDTLRLEAMLKRLR